MFQKSFYKRVTKKQTFFFLSELSMPRDNLGAGLALPIKKHLQTFNRNHHVARIQGKGKRV